MNHNTESTLSAAFLSPLLDNVESLDGFRNCPSLSDSRWLETGALRAMSASSSGRDFLAQLQMSNREGIGIGHFFGTLRSARRLRLCQSAASSVSLQLKGLRDELAGVPELDGFDVLAGDGHFHAAAAHDQRIGGTKYATGHFYGFDLRSRALFHLQVADPDRAKEHDMRVLKRTNIDALRQGAPIRRKVLWVWDRAGIDFLQWYKWKKGSGIYFLSRSKENMKPETLAEHPWEDGPLNLGVVSDRTVSTSAGMSVRQVVFKDPVTGKTLTFITNLPLSIPPGVIAQLYRMRWDIEKVFDELKNKMGETKAWASSANAKSMQANFLCIAHNLLELQSMVLDTEQDITNKAEIERKNRVLTQVNKDNPNGLPKLYLDLQRVTQHSVKLIRWIRYHLWNRTSQSLALPQIRAAYDKL